ncbi:MAG: DEAD/DEAH box helicase family protein [Phycicoccus sp.]
MPAANPRRPSLPFEVKAAARKAGRIVSGLAVTDALGRKWRSELHPRDSRGRFIETGGIASVPAMGIRGRVTRALGNGRIEITTPKGKKHRVQAAQVTMVARPDGSKPVRGFDDKDDSAAAKKARKAVLEQDTKRDGDPERGDGVEADDDGDGVPNDEDAAPDDAAVTRRKPAAARAKRAAEGRDVGDGYRMVDGREDAQSGDRKHELYDADGRLVSVATRTGAGQWTGTVRGRKVTAKNEGGWVAQATLLDGRAKRVQAARDSGRVLTRDARRKATAEREAAARRAGGEKNKRQGFRDEQIATSGAAYDAYVRLKGEDRAIAKMGSREEHIAAGLDQAGLADEREHRVAENAKNRLVAASRAVEADPTVQQAPSSDAFEAGSMTGTELAALTDAEFAEYERRHPDGNYVAQQRAFRNATARRRQVAAMVRRERAAAAGRQTVEQDIPTPKEQDSERGDDSGEVLDDVPAVPSGGERGPGRAVRESRGAGRRDGGGESASGGGEGEGGEPGRDLPADDGAAPVRAGRRRGRRDAGSGVPAAGGGDRGPADAGDGAARVGDARPVADEQPAPRFRPQGQGDLAPSGQEAKLAANMAVLRLLRDLKTEGRPATGDEQRVLARWAGWGALPKVFDERDSRYASERAELKDLLGEREYAAARRGTLNAHYTDAAVVQAVWDGVAALGFDRGDVLEPGSGSGNFIGHAPGGARMTGVELDPTTASIAQYLYPDAEIHNEGFQHSPFRSGTFDAVVGNVPFGNFQLRDPLHNPGKRESIHNHFINRSIDHLKPGGVMAVVTSQWTLDSKDDAHRRRMFAEADLLGAVRLPSGTHKAAADTDVVTDVLVFRKRKDGEPEGDASWLESAPAVDAAGQPVIGANGDQQTISSYYRQHPEDMLGRLEPGGYNGHNLVSEGDTTTRLAARLGAISRDAVSGGRGFDAEPGDGKPNRVGLGPADGKIVLSGVGDDGVPTFTTFEDGQVVEHTPNGKDQARELAALLDLRGKAANLLAAEADPDASDDEIEDMRSALNRAYDTYAKKYGPIGRYSISTRQDKHGNYRRTNPQMGGFRKDFTSAEVFALEKSYDPDTNTARKSDLFTKRQVMPPKESVTAVDTPDDAVTLLEERGDTITWKSLADTLGVDVTDVQGIAGDAVFVDPSDRGRLIGRGRYLADNVRAKLREVEAMLADTPDDADLARNAAALREVVPPDAAPDEVPLQLGAVWMPTNVIEAFANDLMRFWPHQPGVAISQDHNGLWTVPTPRGGQQRRTSLEREVWGTPNLSFYQLLQSVMRQNHRTITVRSKNSDGDTVIDSDATDAAREKAAEIAARWEEWVFERPDVMESLSAAYSERFRARIPRDYDGSPARAYEGMSEQVSLMPHQNDAVTRMVNEPAVLLEHEVGAGKTFTMAGGLMELRRLGLVRKPVLVVPNSLLDQWVREFKQLYPNAKVLAADGEATSPKNRRRFAALARNNDWDAVVMTRTAFEAVPVSPDYEAGYLGRELDRLRAALLDVQNVDGETPAAKSKTVKQVETAIVKAEERIAAQLEKRKDDDGITFESMGFDYVASDEAHAYKNLNFLSRIDGIQSPAGSGRARDMHMKLELLRENAGDENARVATFATGTPVSNSLAEMYTMTRFLRPDLLEEADIDQFDSWAATLAQTAAKMELNTAGDGYQLKVRMRGFTDGIGDGLRIWRTFSDVKTFEDLTYLSRPGIVGGERRVHVVPMSDAQESAKATFRSRVNSLKPKPGEGDDNHLAIIGDGRVNAIAPGLMSERGRDEARITAGDPDAFESPKLDRMADQIADTWSRMKDRTYKVDARTDEDSPNRGALQMVMGDSSRGAYELLKAKLVARGIDPARIRVAQDEKNKQKLYADARDGKVDVLFGSTEALGTGVNVQNRLYALHHMDASWKPSDIEQREGRILRQGNQHADVEVHVYATENTHDVKTWDMIAYKQAGLDQLRRASYDQRGLEFADDEDPLKDFDTIAGDAAGNPLIGERRDLEAQLRKMEKAGARHAAGIELARQRSQRYTDAAEAHRTRAAVLRQAAPAVTSTRGDAFAMQFGEMTVSDRGDAAAAIEAKVKAALANQYLPQGARAANRVLDGDVTIGGLTAQMFVYRTDDNKRFAEYRFVRPGQSPYSLPEMPLDPVIVGRDGDGAGVVTRLENRVNGLDAAAAREMGQADANDAEASALLGSTARQFSGAQDLLDSRKQMDLLNRLLADGGKPEQRGVWRAEYERLKTAGAERVKADRAAKAAEAAARRDAKKSGAAQAVGQVALSEEEKAEKARRLREQVAQARARRVERDGATRQTARPETVVRDGAAPERPAVEDRVVLARDEVQDDLTEIGSDAALPPAVEDATPDVDATPAVPADAAPDLVDALERPEAAPTVTAPASVTAPSPAEFPSPVVDEPAAAVAAARAPKSRTKKPPKRDEVIFHEQYGDVSRGQLAAYRKHNIPPATHDDLVDHYGEDAHNAIRAAVADPANHMPGSGMFDGYLWRQNLEDAELDRLAAPAPPARSGPAATDGHDGLGGAPEESAVAGATPGRDAPRAGAKKAGDVEPGDRVKVGGEDYTVSAVQDLTPETVGVTLVSDADGGAIGEVFDKDGDMVFPDDSPEGVPSRPPSTPWDGRSGEWRGVTGRNLRAGDIIQGWGVALGQGYRGSKTPKGRLTVEFVRPTDGRVVVEQVNPGTSMWVFKKDGPPPSRDDVIRGVRGDDPGPDADVPALDARGDDGSAITEAAVVPDAGTVAEELPSPDDLPDPAEEAAAAADGETRSPEMLPGETYAPSPQQQAVYDAVLAGRDVKVQAKAGAGKTSTLEGLARRIGEQDPKARIVYVAFNKSVQAEAETRMPGNVEARTGHSIAWQWAPDYITGKFGQRGQLRRPDAIARHLGLRDMDDENGGLDTTEQAMAVVKTVDRYSTSSDDEITAAHLPERFRNLPSEGQATLVKAAGKAWSDLKDRDGKLRLTQDHIRKMWALSKPDLTGSSAGLKRGATVLFLDEAQDTPPVLAKVVADQKMRKVVVGDGDQAIYGFTGAVDYLERADADVELPLTKSYRFGPAVADAGNRFLQLLGSKTRVVGGGPESTLEEDMDRPDAVLVRSNAGMLDEIAREVEDGRKVAVTKGTKADLLSLAESADYLRGTGPAPERMHDDLEPFSTWPEVKKEAEKGDDPKLAMLARMVEQRGTDGIRDLVERVTEIGGDLLDGVTVEQDDRSLSLSGRTFELNRRLKADTGSGLGQFGFRWNGPKKAWTVTGDEAARTRALERVREFAAPGFDADVTITTAHKAKGLEWDRVRIGSDFKGPKEDPDTGQLVMPSPEELRLDYVAVTRAKEALDPGTLGWVYDHTGPDGREAASPDLAEDTDVALSSRESDSAPSSPASQAKTYRDMTLEELDAAYLAAAGEGMPDPTVEDAIDYEYERRRMLDPALLAQVSDSDLHSMVGRATRNDDGALADAVLTEMHRRDDEGTPFGEGGTPATPSGDDGVGAPQDPPRKAPTKKAQRDESIRLLRDHNLELLNRVHAMSDQYGSREGSTHVGVGDGAQLIEGLPRRDQNTLLDGKGVPGVTIAKNVPEEATLAVWGMTPEEIRGQYGMSRLHVPGAIDRDDWLADRERGGSGFGDNEHADRYGIGEVDEKDLSDAELADSLDAARRRGDDDSELDLMLEQVDREQMPDADRERAEQARRKRRTEEAVEDDRRRDRDSRSGTDGGRDVPDAQAPEDDKESDESDGQGKRRRRRRRRKDRDKNGKGGRGLGGPDLPHLPHLPGASPAGAGGDGRRAGSVGYRARQRAEDSPAAASIADVEYALDAADGDSNAAESVPSAGKDGRDLTADERAQEADIADAAFGDPAAGIEEHIAVEDLPDGQAPGTGTVGGESFPDRVKRQLAEAEGLFDRDAAKGARKKTRTIGSAADLRRKVGDAVAEWLLTGGEVDAESLRGALSPADLKEMFGLQGRARDQQVRWAGAPSLARRAGLDADAANPPVGGSLPGSDDRRRAAFDAADKGGWSAPLDPRDLKRGDLIALEDPAGGETVAAVVSAVRPMARYGQPWSRVETDRGDRFVPADDLVQVHVSSGPGLRVAPDADRALMDEAAAAAADRTRGAGEPQLDGFDEDGYAASPLPAGSLPVRAGGGMDYAVADQMIRPVGGAPARVRLVTQDGATVEGVPDGFHGGDSSGTVEPRVRVRTDDGFGVWVPTSSVASARLLGGEMVMPGASVAAGRIPDGVVAFRRHRAGERPTGLMISAVLSTDDSGIRRFGSPVSSNRPIAASDLVRPAYRVRPADGDERDLVMPDRGALPEGDGRIVQDSTPVETTPSEAAEVVGDPDMPEVAPSEPESGDVLDRAIPDDGAPTAEPEPQVEVEPAVGRMPEWVTVDSLQIGDYARVDGITNTGEPATGAGWLVNDPTPVTWQGPDGVTDLLGVTMDEAVDGPGSTVVFVPLDRLVALAPRMETDEFVDSGMQMPQSNLDVRDGRMPDRIPSDASRLGLFPRSRVEDVDGQRTGVVLAARGQDVTVRWADDGVENTTGGSLRVTDDGVARPDGWTRDGTRMPDASEMEERVGARQDPGSGDPARPESSTGSEDLDEVAEEVEQLAIDVVAAVQDSLPGLDAMSQMTPAQIERLVQDAARKATLDASARHREMAQRMVARRPYQPGLFATVLGLLLAVIGYAMLALIKAIVWSMKRGNREMAKDRLAMIVRAAVRRTPDGEKLRRTLGSEESVLRAAGRGM